MSKNTIRVIISGGGTGGHIYPAIAIADAIKEQSPNAEILFVGAEGKMEMEKVPQAGYEIKALPVVGLQRRLTLKNLLFPFKLLKSIIKARNIVRSFKPNVAVGVGGYASGPILRVCVANKIPAVLQEQNSYAGLTNKILSKHVKTICVAYPDMEQYFPKEKIQFTGNPVRKGITSTVSDKNAAADFFGLEATKPTLLVLGGSLGARTINNVMKLITKDLVGKDIQVLWQCGKFYEEEMVAFYQENNWPSVKVLPFIAKMDLAYTLSDVVVSRAGALSVTELSLAGKASILVPSPNVAEDHQTKNAMSLVKYDAALLVKDNEVEKELLPTILKVFENSSLKTDLEQNILKLAKPQAAVDVAKKVMEVAK